MRRFSLLLAAAAVLVAFVVGLTYQLRSQIGGRHTAPTPNIQPSTETVANNGWEYKKDDPQTNKPVVIVHAKSLEATQAPATFKLRGLELRLFHKNGESYTYVQGDSALFDEVSGSLKSEGPISIVMNVPHDKDASKPDQVANLVSVTTSGVAFDTKTQKADTNQPATFHFPKGGGAGTGVAYDPATGDLHIKSQVSLDWVGNGPAANKMHIEAGDLVYKEREQKIYLTPWSKLIRQGTTVQAMASTVLLQDGVLHQVDSEHASGADVREAKHTAYSADHLTAHFNDDGVMTEMDGAGNARVASEGLTSKTTMTGDRAQMVFQVVQEPEKNGAESDLQCVTTDGHAVAQSEPMAKPKPGVAVADTRILRSEHIELMMKPGGQDVQEIRTNTQAQLEFKPNQAGAPHRIVDASRLQVVYGEGNYIDRFVAANAKTQTDRSVAKSAANATGISTAYTWSDQLNAVFVPESNNVQTIEQRGHFRYQEGARKANSDTALLEQASNRITLTSGTVTDGTRVADDKGSTLADRIVMNQGSGDMNAFGHVMSAHAPDKNAKPGTSMLDNTETMQAKADQMETRDSNSHIFYQGHVVLWQGANRLLADRVEIDRENGNLNAQGKVVSELVDTRNDATAPAGTNAPVFTVVHAPSLVYTDNDRLATYTGGVELTHDKMTVDSKELKAFLTPKSDGNKGDSSLDHAFAEGDVKVSEEISPGDTRVGSSEHAEFYTKLNKVVLNGGAPQLEDTRKGITRGRQLTYFSDDDRLIVEGEKKQMAYTKMKKK